MAVTVLKYTSKTDAFIEEHLGVRIIRPEGRGLRIGYEIVNQDVYRSHFGEKELAFVGAKPKDMAWLIAMNRVDGAVTYTVISNFPQVYKTICEVPDSDVQLALIQNNERPVNDTDWNSEHKITIASEHPKQIYEYLRQIGMSGDSFTLDHVLGSSESYIVNIPDEKYALCDAIIETGSTLRANGLSVWRTVLEHGKVKIGFYMRLLRGDCM